MHFVALCLVCSVHASVPGANHCYYIFLKALRLLWREFRETPWASWPRGGDVQVTTANGKAQDATDWCELWLVHLVVKKIGFNHFANILCWSCIECHYQCLIHLFNTKRNQRYIKVLHIDIILQANDFGGLLTKLAQNFTECMQADPDCIFNECYILLSLCHSVHSQRKVILRLFNFIEQDFKIFAHQVT